MHGRLEFVHNAVYPCAAQTGGPRYGRVLADSHRVRVTSKGAFVILCSSKPATPGGRVRQQA